MGYLEDVDSWLNEVLRHLPIDHLEETKKQISAKILESYKNGVKKGQAEASKKSPVRKSN